MKTILITWGILIAFGLQARELFTYDPAVNTDSLPSSVLAVADSVYAGSLNTDAFADNRISLSIPGRETVYFNVVEKDAQKWVGNETDNKGDMILVLNDNKITGTITIGFDTYQICSIDNEKAALIKIDHIKYREQGIIPGIPDIPYTLSSATANLTDEKLRVLVAYTPAAAQNAVPDIMSRVKLAVEETNKSFLNSEINHRIELAACIPVNYTSQGYGEYDFGADLSAFSGKNDGYMDDIHLFRDQYAADLCVLLIDPGGMGCGAPLQIKADNNTAFCIVRADCATGNYSFAQMIGYLIGAGDNKDHAFFRYGHGYVSWNKKWRTIMAYDVTMPRINYWSSSTVVFPADNDNRTGDAYYEDNARVLNEQMNAAKAFRHTLDHLLLDSLPDGSPFFLDAGANDSIAVEGNIIINENDALSLKAGNRITIRPGFHAKNGSYFLASAWSAAPLGRFSVRSVSGTDETLNPEDDETLVLAPNPVISEGVLFYKLQENQRIRILLTNSAGIHIKTIVNDRLQEKGEHAISFSRVGLPSGNYFITLITENKVTVCKAIFL